MGIWPEFAGAVEEPFPSVYIYMYVLRVSFVKRKLFAILNIEVWSVHYCRRCKD